MQYIEAYEEHITKGSYMDPTLAVGVNRYAPVFYPYNVGDTCNTEY